MGDKLLENFLPLFDIFCVIDTFWGGALTVNGHNADEFLYHVGQKVVL